MSRSAAETHRAKFVFPDGAASVPLAGVERPHTELMEAPALVFLLKQGGFTRHGQS